MMSKQRFSQLLILTGWFLFAGIISYISARLFTPALFPHWGVILLILLGLWSVLCVNLLLGKSRQSRWFLLSFLIALCLVSSQMAWSGLAGLLIMVGAIALLILLILLMGMLHLFKRQFNLRFLLLGFIPLLAGALLLSSANLQPELPAPINTVSVSQEIRYLYEMDQRDRQTGRFILDATRDQKRLQRILAIDQQQQITTPEAQYHAAMLLQHGTCPDHFKRAYELAQAAAIAHISGAQALAYASYDRWMLSINQPQKYNTQWLINQANCRTFTPI